jgi:hypothetical protein
MLALLLVEKVIVWKRQVTRFLDAGAGGEQVDPLIAEEAEVL